MEISSKKPASHIQGHGCPSCASHGFDPSKPGVLYYLKITTDDGQILYKIGITNNSVNERFSLKELSKIEIIKQKLYEKGQDAYDMEQKLLKRYKHYQYIGPKILECGNTELFYKTSWVNLVKILFTRAKSALFDKVTMCA